MPLNVLTRRWSFRQKSVILMHLLIHSTLAHKAQWATESQIHLLNELLKVRERQWHPTALNFRSFKVNSICNLFNFYNVTFILTLLSFDYKNICLEYCAIMNFDFHFHNATAYTKMHVNNYKRMGYLMRVMNVKGADARLAEWEAVVCSCNC